MAHMVSVNSGPSENIIRRMKKTTRDLMANGVGSVITTAAETKRSAHRRPEKWGPISVNKI